MEIHNLFPTPIYTSNINRKFTEKELIFVKNQKKILKKMLEVILLLPIKTY